MRFALHFLVPLAVLTPLPGQQGDVARAVEFSAEVQVVNVFATVRDRNGHILTGLGRDDFIVWEDGFVQDIAYFAYETDVPLKVGLLVDTSGSQVALIPEERRAGRQFLGDVLRPKTDLAFLLTFDREVELHQDFTSSLELLNGALDDLHVKPFFAIAEPPPARNVRPVGTALYDGLFLAAEELFRLQDGRKVAVIISDGYDLGSRIRLSRAVESALRADVVVYSIQYLDWRFVTNAYGNDHESGAEALRQMSEKTGGAFFRVSEKLRLSDVFRQIEEEMRGVYSIGYTPRRGLDDLGYRRIRLTSPRMEIKQIQARDGYYPDAMSSAKR